MGLSQQTVPGYLVLQLFLYFINHIFVGCICQVNAIGIHGKGAVPFKFIFILRNQMDMQMMSRISICTVVYFIRMEGCVNGLRSSCDVGKKGVAFFIAQFRHFADMIFISDEAAAGMALFLE